MTFDTFDQSDKATWPDQKMTSTKTNTKTITKTNTFREHLQRAILETCDLWDIWLKRWGDMTMTMTNTKTKTMTKTNTLRAPSKSDPSDLWHLRHWLHFWQLRTWFLDNLCYLTIKSDTGQHSQFLRCFFLFCTFPLCDTILPNRWIFFDTMVPSNKGEYLRPQLIQYYLRWSPKSTP